LLRIGLVTESQETIATRFARVHVPHDASIGQSAEGREGLGKDIVIDLGRKVTNKDMEMVRRVLLVLLALICPIYADLRVKYLTAVESLKSSFCGTHVHVLDEAIIKATVLVVAVWDYLDVLYRTSDSKNFREHVFGHSWAEISHVKVGSLLVERDEFAKVREQKKYATGASAAPMAPIEFILYSRIERDLDEEVIRWVNRQERDEENLRQVGDEMRLEKMKRRRKRKRGRKKNEETEEERQRER
jgi:hypothetical protein